MITVHFIRDNNEKITVKVPVGHTVMEAAKEADLPEIPADCGGCCACATCHVYVVNKIEKLISIDDDEESMLDQAFEVQKNSRLGCQIEYNDELDGLELTLAPQ